MRFKMNVTFSGTATLEMEADSVEAARVLASELTLADLARSGHTDVLTFKVAAREVTAIAALSGQSDDTHGGETPRKARPSGWYRPK